MTIFLIRHGETALNAAQVVQLPDTPLNARGNAQARRLATRFADARVTHVLASDLARARETAEYVHATTGGTFSVSSTLQERNFGRIRGRAYSEFDFDLFGPTYEPPEGESWDVFHARVDRAWEEVTAAAAATSGDLAVVSHGLVCHSIAHRLLQLPAGCEAPRHWGNTSVTEIDATPPWQVRTLNCTAHLDDGSADDPDAVAGL